MKSLNSLTAIFCVFFIPQIGNAFTCPASGQVSSQALILNEASNTLSQVIRDNTPHYLLNFNCFEKSISDPNLKKIFSFKGLIFGDNHPGNWTLGPVGTKLEFFMADLDDAGVGTYLSDINRLILNTYAVGQENKIVNLADVETSAKFRPLATVLFQEYLLGLKGITKEPSNYIRNKTSTTFAEYRKLEAEYALKWTHKNQFAYETGEIEEITPSSLKASILSEMKKATSHSSSELRSSKLLDIGIRPKDRGGSKSLERYWLLLQLPNQTLRIIEFKELGPPAPSLILAQEPAKNLFEKLKVSLWPNSDLNYMIVSIKGKNFVMRPKKMKTDLVVPYDQKTESEFSHLLEYSKRVAYLTGLAHGKQKDAKEYTTLLETNLINMIESLRKFNKAYVDALSRN